jgi:hypothetical protein
MYFSPPSWQHCNCFNLILPELLGLLDWPLDTQDKQLSAPFTVHEVDQTKEIREVLLTWIKTILWLWLWVDQLFSRVYQNMYSIIRILHSMINIFRQFSPEAMQLLNV